MEARHWVKCFLNLTVFTFHDDIGYEYHNLNLSDEKTGMEMSKVIYLFEDIQLVKAEGAIQTWDVC